MTRRLGESPPKSPVSPNKSPLEAKSPKLDLSRPPPQWSVKRDDPLARSFKVTSFKLKQPKGSPFAELAQASRSASLGASSPSILRGNTKSILESAGALAPAAGFESSSRLNHLDEVLAAEDAPSSSSANQPAVVEGGGSSSEPTLQEAPTGEDGDGDSAADDSAADSAAALTAIDEELQKPANNNGSNGGDTATGGRAGSPPKSSEKGRRLKLPPMAPASSEAKHENAARALSKSWSPARTEEPRKHNLNASLDSAAMRSALRGSKTWGSSSGSSGGSPSVSFKLPYPGVDGILSKSSEDRNSSSPKRSSLRPVQALELDWSSELGDAYLEEAPSDLELVEDLPTGSSASISVMKRLSDNAHLVVKRIALPSEKGPGVSLLINEVRLLNELTHKHIVRFRGAYTQPGHLCILLDYCAGGSLEIVIEKQRARALQNRDGFDTEMVRLWLAQLASATLFMHSHHMLHRDLSTHNVFLDFFANVVLGDLGLAKRVAVTDSHEALATTKCGTPDFLSPELVLGKPYGAASDAWAVGCILFNLLALDRPFRHTSILGLARQIVDVDVTTRGRIALNNAKHPADLKVLASKDGLLNPDPERRTTLSEIVDRFQDILEEDEEGMV